MIQNLFLTTCVLTVDYYSARNLYMQKLKILSHFAHATYQTFLSKVPNTEFYHVVDTKGVFPENVRPKPMWSGENCPSNIKEIEAADVNPADFDILLIHWHPFIELFCQKWSSIPSIMIEHTWPFKNLPSEVNRWHVIREAHLDHTVFITPSSQEAWGEKNNPKACAIYHSIDLIELPRKVDYTIGGITTTTNEFISRDWACGFTLWCSVLGLPHAPYFKDISLYGYGNDNIGKVAKGPLSNALIWRKLQNETGVYFNPSIMSPIPMSLLEAVAIGVPIVSTAYCEPGKIFQNGVHGIISNDIAELRSGIKMILANPSKGKEFVVNAMKVVSEKFAPYRFQQEWKNVFENVAKQRG